MNRLHHLNLLNPLNLSIAGVEFPSMKITTLLTAAVLALATPALAQRKIELPYTQFTLPNGLTVILHEDHAVPLVSTNMWYHVGSAREKTGRTGFAHLFEHLMFMGSGHVKPGEFDDWLEGVGVIESRR